jgi:hypothetical protein
MYGEVDDLLETIKGWDVASVEFLNASGMDCIPRALRLAFMVGAIGILYGEK